MSYIVSRSTNPDVYDGEEHFVVVDTDAGNILADIEHGISPEAEATANTFANAAELLEGIRNIQAMSNEDHVQAFCKELIALATEGTPLPA